MLRVGLREHRQFDIRGAAPELAEVLPQIVDFIFRQRQPQVAVRGAQCVDSTRGEIHALHRLGFNVMEQRVSRFQRIQHGLGHAVVDQWQQRGLLRRRKRTAAAHVERRAPLDARDRFESAMTRDVGRLR